MILQSIFLVGTLSTSEVWSPPDELIDPNSDSINSANIYHQYNSRPTCKCIQDPSIKKTNDILLS